MKREMLAAVAVAFLFAFPITVGVLSAADVTTSPPPTFKKVSSLVKLPDYLPGLGVLYVDPSTLPVGPFLGYDKDGKLVNITYMIPIKDFEAHKNLPNLGANLGDLKIDHTDIEFNPGHPGVQEAHYHVIEWLISKDQVDARMK